MPDYVESTKDITWRDGLPPWPMAVLFVVWLSVELVCVCSGVTP